MEYTSTIRIMLFVPKSCSLDVYDMFRYNGSVEIHVDKTLHARGGVQS